MSDIKPFLVQLHPSPDEPLENDMYESFAEVFRPHLIPPVDNIELSEDDIKALQYACLDDATKMIDYLKPEIKKDKKQKKLQLQAIEKIADNAQKQADSSKRLAKSANDIAVSAQNQANNSMQIAESSHMVSRLATEKSKQADVKSWIAIGISLITLIIEIIVNRAEIISFIQSLTS